MAANGTRHRDRAYAGNGSRRGLPISGANARPLTARESARWTRLENDAQRREWRDRPHNAQMVYGLGLCNHCYGWVDDWRHVKIGPPVAFGSRE